MSVIELSLVGARQVAASRRLWPTILVMAVCATFMFFDLRPPPIVLWDESRIAVNALEMHLSGHLSLVTTYGFAPDLWNTKPPLLIWLMDLSMSLFGVSEWSLRLPSMLASMGTLALTLSFTRRITGSFGTAALATGLLATSILFFSEHGARTADYDALLGFFTTGYLYLLFFALHRRRPGPLHVAAIATLICLAVMTKSAAGLLPGVGVPLYLLIVGRWRRPFQSPWYSLFGVLAMAGPAAFVVMREHAAPGYVRAATFNDVAGRFNRTLDRHAGGALYYPGILMLDGGFSGGWLPAIAPLSLVLAKGRSRLALLYSLCVVCGFILILSLSATKLPHYTLSALPFMAAATAIALREMLHSVARARADGRLSVVSPRLAKGLVAAALAVAVAPSLYVRAVWLPAHEFNPQALYGELFRDLAAKGIRSIRVVDGGVVKPGVVADGVAHDYAPQLDFYRLLARSQGLDVARISASALERQDHGAVLVTCDPEYAARVAGRGTRLPTTPGCVAVR